jgi:oligo-1,6-glucosidase
VFHHYRRLIELRHTEPVVARGDFTMLLPEDETVYAFTRSLDDVELLVAANFSGERVRPDLDLTDWADAALLLGNVAPGAMPWDGSLEPWEARIMRRRR